MSTQAPARANRELVVYGLYVAGGATDRIHTEDVALKCWELFPDSFSWTKYPRYPDKDIVRVALTDARKEKYGALVAGKVEGHTAAAGASDPEGWLLTERGLAWINDNASSFNNSGKADRKAHRQVVLKRIKEIRDHQIFRQFDELGSAFSPGIGELAAFLKCRVDANAAVWQRRFAEIRRLGIDASEDTVIAFAAACEAAYERER